jgi:RNA polymerase sigma-70 factor (ECF subfamily)
LFALDTAGLWNKIRDNDTDAFIALYNGLYKPLYAFGCSVYTDAQLVKDCMHEMFCELWDRRDTLPEVGQPLSYLFTYLKRKIRKEADRMVRQTDYHEQVEMPGHEHSYEDLLIGLEKDEATRARLQHFVNTLSPAQQTAIRLKFFEGLTYEQIAERLSWQPRTAYNKVYEALKILRQSLRTVLLLLATLLTD